MAYAILAVTASGGMVLAGLLGDWLFVGSPGPGPTPSRGRWDVPLTVLLGDDAALALLQGTSVLLLAPVIEETLFRGYVYRRMRCSFGVTISTLATSFVFALPHESPNMLHFLLGVLLCLLYERRRDLTAPMIAHAAINASPSFFELGLRMAGSL